MDLNTLTIESTRAAIERGETTATALAEAHLARIAAEDGAINSVLATTQERALKQAAFIDSLVKNGDPLPPLAGVPAILVQTADNPDPVRVGDQTTYTIEVTNQGTAPGTNIKLVCTLEDPMSFVTASGETKDTVDGKTITFEPLGSLAPKAKAVYKVTVKAAKSGDVRFKTIITSDQLGRPVESTEATTFFGQ